MAARAAGQDASVAMLALMSWVLYYNETRTHLSLDKGAPISTRCRAAVDCILSCPVNNSTLLVELFVKQSEAPADPGIVEQVS